ncbi:hypothetical protein Goshw_011388 [Gossypium schwendimanii]|uniref:Uncharacterized protein n=1 Tax=Gossypium schwendimanii TaxID=34291 RepID=A0A7J9N6L8_GOSSC|nr:hypothetical protein [Gossypium schwendimanii]
MPESGRGEIHWMCITSTQDCSHTDERRHFRGEVDGNSSESLRRRHRVESSLVVSR